MRVLFRLLPCALCGLRASAEWGCCHRCRSRLFAPWADTDTLALGTYRGALRGAVGALKFRSVTRLAALFGSRLGIEVARLGWRLDVVCAVPLHPIRLGTRGYNQAELVARTLAAHLGLPYRELLRRVRPTRQQARLGLAERRANVEGAFAAGSAAKLRVLLVDDVLTSGATSGACRRALLAAGAAAVYLAVVARV